MIICGYAGPWVEARKRRRSLFAVMSLDGRDDIDEVDSILEWVAPDNTVRKQLAHRCERIVKQFLRGRGIQQQVEAVANILIRHGTIEGDHPLLAGIEGMCPLSKWAAI